MQKYCSIKLLIASFYLFMYQKIKYFILFLGDIVVLYLSLWLTLLLRYQQSVSIERWQTHFLPFSFIFVVWLLIFYISGIYSLNIAKNNFSKTWDCT